MIRDRFTQRLMLAWPYLDMEGPKPWEEVEAVVGQCMRCKAEESTRYCNQCVGRRSSVWGEVDGQPRIHFCFVCFAEAHKETAHLRRHTFSITKLPVARPLTC